jgi:threonine dehydratase
MTAILQDSGSSAYQQPDVLAARERIKHLVVNTPLLEFTALSERLGCRVYCKCENLQRTGAFKFRGASNAVLSLLEQGPLEGVATHSSGNHGYALATAAAMHGIRAEIVVPNDVVATKLAAIETTGAIVHICAANQAAREAGLEILVAKGLVPVHPFDYPPVIAGQGTAALEMMESDVQLDCIITPIGGGGLMAGSALAVAAVGRYTQIFGAEPEGADDAWQSLECGERVTDIVPETVADGLRATVGELTFPIIQKHATGILRVSEQEIIAAMRLCWEQLNVVIEPSSATVLAALERYPETFHGKNVGAILSGGNLDLENIAFIQD